MPFYHTMIAYIWQRCGKENCFKKKAQRNWVALRERALRVGYERLEKEVASLFVPADKAQNSIFKIKHLSNREFFLNSSDASREFVLKVIETICGGGLYHEEGSRKSFNI